MSTTSGPKLGPSRSGPIASVDMNAQRDLSGLFARIGSVFTRGHQNQEKRAGNEDIERLLAEGYAEAIALELEQARIERRIADLFAAGPKRADRSPAAELRELGERRLARQQEIDRLRSMLEELRDFAASMATR
jgi:hypothetical protein